jgi:hypothetical protein
LQRAGRPKKIPSLQETQAKSDRKESSKKKGITIDEIDEETVNCDQLQSCQCNICLLFIIDYFIIL